MCDVRQDKLAIKIKGDDFRMYASYVFDKRHFLVDYLDRQTRTVRVFLITLSEVLQELDGVEHLTTESSLDEDSDDSLINENWTKFEMIFLAKWKLNEWKLNKAWKLSE